MVFPVPVYSFFFVKTKQNKTKKHLVFFFLGTPSCRLPHEQIQAPRLSLFVPPVDLPWKEVVLLSLLLVSL